MYQTSPGISSFPITESYFPIRNIRFPFMCSITLPYLPVCLPHTCLQSIYTDTFYWMLVSSIQFSFSSNNTTLQNSALFPCSRNLSTKWQNYSVVLYELKTPFHQAFPSTQFPRFLQKSWTFLYRGETKLRSLPMIPFWSLPSTQRQPDCSTQAYMSTRDWDISWSPMR